jgi:hypothetical protein
MISRVRPLLALGILCLCSCAYVGALQTWSPSRAPNDAERDIAANNIRFAYVGGRASHAPGLPEDAFRVIRRYPHLPVGPQGCDQDNSFDIRAEYARRYNVRMWQHVSRMQRQSSNHAMQRTATRCAITFPMIKTLPLRLALALGSRR